MSLHKGKAFLLPLLFRLEMTTPEEAKDDAQLHVTSPLSIKAVCKFERLIIQLLPQVFVLLFLAGKSCLCLFQQLLHHAVELKLELSDV